MRLRVLWLSDNMRFGPWPPQYMDAGPVKGFDVGPIRVWWGPHG